MNAKIKAITKGGQIIHPATTTEAVVDPHLRVDSTKIVEEINVSKIFPNGGIAGTNKYDLPTAIAKIPLAYRNVGMKCSFISELGKVEIHMWQGGTWEDLKSWVMNSNNPFEIVGETLITGRKAVTEETLLI